MRKLLTDFGRGEVPSVPYVRYLVKKVNKTGILIDKPRREKTKTVRTPKNIAAVTENVYEFTAIQHFGDSRETNLHKDFGIKPYKVQLVQEFKPIDQPMRFRFVKWACDRLAEEI